MTSDHASSPPEDDTANLDGDFDTLKSAVAEAARLVKGYFESDLTVRNKVGGSPVTEADDAADALLKERLTGAQPDYGWLSEETEDTADRLSARKVWIVDPIDGTRAFIKGRPHFAVCGALIDSGSPVLAVVHNPATGEVFSARKGHGAWIGDTPIRVTTRETLAGARLVGPKDMYRHKAWREPWPQSIEIDNPNSIAYRLCLVAAGLRDACVRLGSSQEWDLAAAHLVATEAGATVTDHAGGDLTYNKPHPILKSMIAAGPGLYQEIYRRTHMIRLPGQA